MKDLKAELERLLAQAEDCELISKLAIDPDKRIAFRRLSEQFHDMADDIQRVIDAKLAGDATTLGG